MTQLSQLLRSRLRGEHANKDLIHEASDRRIVLALVAMASQGGNVLCVLPTNKRCREAMHRAIEMCDIAGITYIAKHDQYMMYLYPEPTGRILFNTIDTSPEKFMGLELTGVWINETT